SLTLADGVVLKFAAESAMVVQGPLQNHDGTEVYFTSFKDDSHKGDTNGDATATTAADGDWDGLYDGDGNRHTWPNVLFDGV
ncbi:MAG: hypothetical protein JRH20_28325, partial [Deltaproteobacteria bacterium]|nr:hypothetical protein [Deltaproteobacteria bacterium]